MSGAGNCYDNAITERFFGSLKAELVYFEDYKTREEAKRSIFDYVEVFYNRARIHSSLGYVSPADYELKLANAAYSKSTVHFSGGRSNGKFECNILKFLTKSSVRAD